MNDIEFARYMINFIEEMGGADKAIAAIRATTCPHKFRAAKKLMLKIIRTYKFKSACKGEY